MGIEYFCCYHSYRKKCEKLSDQEVGRLFRALLEYSELGTAPELTGRESFAFDFIADDIDRAKKAYVEKVGKMAENGRRGAEKRWNQNMANDGKNGNCYYGMANDGKNNQDKDKDEDIYTPPPYNPPMPDGEKAALFAKFWEAYPRQVAAAAALEAWQAIDLSQELFAQIMAALETWKGSREWSDEGGKYIPNPAKWLSEARWEYKPAPPEAVPRQRRRKAGKGPGGDDYSEVYM